ncbi:MAG TPA: tetratricopeptide repeat protein [Methanoculleus sp.]|uniref:tetratricopeptide repeat protein n=1 Tax=Methanoculleus sp. TaxID=90427 RepID=UPI002C384D74|nr:tetratricopeptide repeat protein [Methanoculleus sp.]HOC83844.1 tetratricopeptide repeat protein [Methanoculleus sp.]HOF96256.1 tetratricopeptide repeat protein [Methanoculleus sp.]HQL59317.1 tetratricopeptide repeat protein [Methanoculleus sp.]
MQKYDFTGASNGADCLVRQAREKSMHGDHTAAVEYLMEAVDIEPKHPEAFALMGDCCDYLGQYEQAIANYDRALELDPYHADAWFNKGMSLRSIGRNIEAVQCIEKSIELYCGR